MLHGRDEEQRDLGRLLAAARSGRSGSLVLSGEAGIGKSALLDAAERLAAGMRVLRARGVEAEGGGPFGGLLELLRPALRALDRVPGPQAAALESALALRPGGGHDRFAVGAATLSLLAASAEDEPLLVLVDDAQWLDGASGEALLFAFRRLVADPIAVVLAVRTGEPSFVDGTDLPVRTIDGISREAATELLPGQPAELVDRLHAATGGNPLALLELDHDALAALPPVGPVPVSTHIGSAFLRRSTGLSAAARRDLLLVAASDSGDLSLLARAGATAAALEETERAGLIVLAAGAAHFTHPLARSAVYAEAAADERRAAHRALAEALPDRDADRRAWHLAVAATGVDAAASAALAQAAQRARGRSAFSVASAAFERAGRLEPDDERRGLLLYESADTAWLGGRPDRARSLLDEAERNAPGPRIDALKGQIATRAGPVMDGFELLVSAAGRSAPREAVRMLAEAADACFYSGAAGPMLDVADRLEQLVEADGDAAFYAAVVRGAGLVLSGGNGAQQLRRAVELYAQAPPDDDPRTIAWASFGPLFLREAEGRDLIEAAIAAAREHAAVGVLPRLLNRLARDEAATDRWRDAEADFDETIRLARESGQRTELAAALAGLAWLEARQGREEACRTHAKEARELARAAGVGFYELWTYTALGELELALGRPAQAIEELEAHEARAAELALGDVDMSTAPELAEAYLRVGRDDDAASAVDRYARAASDKGQPWALARAARSLGLLAADGFEAHFENALALHAETPDTFETARTRLAYGARLRRARRRVRARAELEAALDAFERLGPSPWAEAARAELAATGVTARRRDPSTRGDLTPQELQIALLLASGKTTREAAAALFLSPKTIEYHLRSVYRKLDVNSRAALADALG